MTMKKLSTLLASAAVVALVAGNAMAGTPSHGSMHHAGAHHVSAPKLSKKLRRDPAVKAYIQANDLMHKDMNIAYSGNADVDFVRGMIPHHQGAVDMAKVQLQYGKDEELKELTRRIITWQEAEIGFMKQWLAGRNSAWQASNACERKSVAAYINSMANMHRDMNIQYTGDADYDFVKGMIPHHQGAIDMAWVLKEHGASHDLRQLADDIIRSQGQEIRWMEAWLAKHPAPEKPKKKRHKKA
jgi:uncharacterized protein (DUF305 family)